MSKKKFFVLDTNIVLHDAKSCTSFEEHDLIIPIQVLSEVDTFKYGSGEINYNAREFIRFIESLPGDKLFDGGASIGKGLGKIRIIMSCETNDKVEKNFPEKIVDNQILNTAYSFKLLNDDSEVILVSKDANLRMKARSLGLQAEDYKTDMVSNVNILYKKTQTINIDETLIDLLFSESEVEFKSKVLGENQYLIVNSNSSKKSGLAVYKKEKLHLIQKNKLSSMGIEPKNREQAFGMHACLDPDINLVTIIGVAGSGKTILSLAVALKLIEDGNSFDQIMFTRQIISLGNKDVGFLPGDAKEKISPFMQGLYDNLGVIQSIGTTNYGKVKKLLDDEKIITEPLFSIRGRSLVNKFFIIDEAQNLTSGEVKAIITRAGEGTKIILLGDITQIDRVENSERSNGLSYVIEKMQGQDLYAHIILKDGVRSRLAELAGNLL